MWVLPKNYHLSSAFAQDMLESKEDLISLESSIESSLMWKSKPTQLRTWLQKWNRVNWLPHLFGRTLKPSHQKSFQEKLTLSLADTHANPFHRLEKEKALKMNATSGHISGNILKPSSQTDAFSRMSKGTFRLDSQQSSATWKKMVTEQRGAYSQRVKLADHTKENGSISWGTPRSCTSMAATLTEKLAQHKHQNLETQVAKEVWATPNTMDHLPQRSKEALIRQEQTTRKGRTKPSNLREQVNAEVVEIYKQVNWPTPTVSDIKGPRGAEAQRKKGNPSDSLPNIMKNLYPDSHPDQTSSSMVGSVQELNPDWVEQLMGIPTGLTDFDCLETE